MGDSGKSLLPIHGGQSFEKHPDINLGMQRRITR